MVTGLHLWRIPCLAVGLTSFTAARADYFAQTLPSDVPGYDRQDGVTVLSRLRPLYEAREIRSGAFTIRPGLETRTGYNGNVRGTRDGSGSWLFAASPSVAFASDWATDRLGGLLALNDLAYLSQPSQNQLNGTAALGGGIAAGRGELALAYSHRWLHETGTQVGALPSLIPIPYQIDDMRGDQTIPLGRLTLSPSLAYSLVRFGDGDLGRGRVSQTYRDRDVLQAGLAVRYSQAPLRDVVAAVRAIKATYVAIPAGQPNPGSQSLLALAGIDDLAEGAIRYRLLAGYEVRAFDSARFKQHAAPIIDAGVIWSPTGLTNVGVQISRTIEDPAAEGTSGYVYTNASLTVDHEYRRNVLLQGRVSLQIADFLQSGAVQTSVSAGGGVTYLLNRNARLSANYDMTSQTNSLSGPLKGGAGVIRHPGAFRQSVGTLALHLSM